MGEDSERAKSKESCTHRERERGDECERAETRGGEIE